MRAVSGLAALLITTGLASHPARANDFDLDLDLDLPAVAPKKAPAAKAKPSKKPSGLELDLDFPAPAPAKPAAKPAPKPNLDLGLDLDLEPAPAPARPPSNAGSLDLDLELDLEPTPVRPPEKPKGTGIADTPKTRPPSNDVFIDPGGVLLLPPGEDFEDPFDAYKPEPVPVEPFHRFDLGLKVGGLVTNALTESGHSTSTGETTATRGFTVPTAVELRVFPTEALRGVAVSLEAGFYPSSGRFSRDLPYDPDFSSLTAEWSMISIPVALGVSYDLPWRAIQRRLGFGVRAAMLGQYVRSSTAWGAGTTTSEGAAASAFAPGWVAGAEVNVKLGPGFLLLDVRTAHAFTDLGLGRRFNAATSWQPSQPWATAASGDVQGTTFLLGYRYVP